MTSPCRPVKVPAGRLRFVLPGPNPGLKVRGNINLFNRPSVYAGHGQYASVHSTSWNVQGLEVLMPTVIFTGGKWRIVTDRQALNYFLKTGRHLGMFDTVAHANSYADRLHRQQARIYCYRDKRR